MVAGRQGTGQQDNQLEGPMNAQTHVALTVEDNKIVEKIEEIPADGPANRFIERKTSDQQEKPTATVSLNTKLVFLCNTSENS